MNGRRFPSCVLLGAALILPLLGFASPGGAEEGRAPSAVHPFDPPGGPPGLEAPLRVPRSQIDSNLGSTGSAAIQSPDGTWSVPFDHPASRRFHCAVYDPVRKREIVFAGYGRPLSLIWTLSLDSRPQWSSFSVAGEIPMSRYGATAIYDPTRDRVIMFGGALQDGNTQLGARTNEAWALSLSGVPTWTRLETGGLQPPPRYAHTAIRESSGDRMIVYGGLGTSTLLGDVWALDLSGATGWTEILPGTPIPPVRYMHAATYDAARDRMVMYGGYGPNFRDINDTWELALSGMPAWRTIAEPGPGSCVGHSLIYDPIADRVVMLGGRDPFERFQPVGAGIWVLRAGETRWAPTQYVRYFQVYGAPAIYDSGRHRIVAYNGSEAMNITDIRLTDPITNYETLLPTPVVRTGQTAMFDPVRDRVLLYGGRSPDSPMSDTWTLSLGAPVIWELLSNDERVDRDEHSAIYDPLRQRMIVYGGWGSTNDVWQQQLSGTPTWTVLAAAGERPPVMINHSAIYDPRRDRMIIFGGGPSPGNTWSLSLDGTPTWTRLPSGPDLSGHIAFYEPVGDRMLALAGTRVWSLSLTEPMQWSELVIEGAGPPARWDAAALYDPIRNRIVAFGGCCFEDEDGNAQDFADAWELSLDGVPRWRALTTSAGPAGRNGASFVYDPVRDQGVLWGGVAPDKVWFDDTWTLRWGNPAKPLVSCPQVVPEAPLRLRYAVLNPLPATRVVEWSLTDDGTLSGLPRRGFLPVGGGATDTVRLELPISDEALDVPHTLRFAASFSGAAPCADSCQTLVPRRPKIIRFELVPHALSIASAGRWVTGCLEPASPLAADDIDIASVRLNGTVAVDATAPGGIGDHDRDGIRDLTVRFSRRGLEPTLSEGDRIPITVTGTVNGLPFIGRDFIRVRQPGNESRGEEFVDDEAVLSNEPLPKPPLAIRRLNGAVAGRLEVGFTLQDGSPAQLVLMDVAGRALMSRQVGAMGPGSHTLELAAERKLPSGIYFLRLSQAGTEASTRVAILR